MLPPTQATPYWFGSTDCGLGVSPAAVTNRSFPRHCGLPRRRNAGAHIGSILRLHDFPLGPQSPPDVLHE